MTMIRSDEYRRIEAALAHDPIIIELAKELHKTGEMISNLTHEDGTPIFNFMEACRREYKARGGKIEGHIGAPARGVLAVMRNL